ncbi:putative 4-amino-4-deoxy-L-arabinose-phosphoundecaprenol flippase subunit ArnF [Planctomycetes bacterium LzC2]|uniref:4-amino-4-deoxy-L-arabinose-phosphoundecaprenol flippase subunit ArnF n=1 Tax=Alienimonas chondri TaxID=2681879 RepID=A0ABX1VI88_9PLAN|nr:putative 4-amino-4-deoxy-L-arabinose-phosphoundecaprenol flippase subunit ArnF [Alienimonas chondri]
MRRMIGYAYVGLTITFTVIGQLLIKWQMGSATLPEGAVAKLLFLMRQLLNPWILCGFASAFLAALCWMAAMTKLPLSRAYPPTSLALVLVLAFSALLFDEKISSSTILGSLLIIAGLLVVAK